MKQELSFGGGVTGLSRTRSGLRMWAGRGVAGLILYLGLSGLLGGVASAQNATGTVLGHVSDPTGAVVPGAKVTLTNLGTGVSHEFTTNSTGDFVFVDQTPGAYKLALHAAGFQDVATSELHLEVEQTLRQNITLQVGSQNQEVIVNAAAQMLQTDNETTGQVISGELMSQLPLNGRDFTNLLQIGVGTTITPGGIQNTGYVLHGLNPSFEEVSINGARADSISYNIDGVTDTDYFFSAPTNIPGELAIEEFKTQNGMYGAEFGQGSAQVNVAIKSGANLLHGSAYDFLQSNIFLPSNAKTAALNTLNGTNDPTNLSYTQNQFGGTFGGPVIIPGLYNGKDKTFYFGSYDGGRMHRLGTPNGYVVPSTGEVQGNFSDWPYPIYDPATTGSVPATANNPTGRTAFPNNMIPAGRIDPRAKALLSYFSAVNTPACVNLISGCDNLNGSVKTFTNTDTETFRIDQNFRAADHLFFTGIFSQENESTPSLIAGQGNVSFFRSRLFGLTWQHTFTNTSINQATLGYNRQHFYTGSNTAGGPNLSADAGFSNVPNIPAYYDLPSINFANTYNSLGGNSPYDQWDNIYQGVDTVTLIRGRHTLNFGIDFRRTNLKDEDSYGAMGSLTFNGQYTASNPADAGGQLTDPTVGPYEGNSFADFLLGDVQAASGPPPLGSDIYGIWGNNWNLFFQDDIRISPNFTLNAGLRWERPTSFHSVDNSGYAFNPAGGGTLVWANRNFVTPILAAGGNPNYLGCCASNNLVPIDNKDFAPRIGFAFRPPMSDRWVIRGGYGIFYDTYNRFYDGTQFDEDALYNTIAAPYPNTTGLEAASPIQLSQLWSTPLTANQGFSQPAYDAPFGQVYWPYNHNPYTQQFTLDTQYSLSNSLLAEIGYVGSLGRRQATQLLFNVAFQPTVAGDPCNSTLDASQATAACLADPNFQPIDTREQYSNMPSTLYANANVLNSSYNSLQVQLIQRPIHGLQYHLNYTYSATLDESSGINNVKGEGGGLIQDPHNPAGDWGPAASDERHRFVATYAYELPFGHGNPHSWRSLLLGGWTTSGIYQIASGFPFSIFGGVSQDQTADGGWQSRYRADVTPGANSGFQRSLSHYFNTAAFSTPALGRYGNSGKGMERTPFFTNFDASAGKVFRINDRQQLQYRVEMFNVASTWHANTSLLFPDSTVTDNNFGSLLSNSQIGNANLFNPYSFQMGLQYSF